MNPHALRWLIRIVLVGLMVTLLTYNYLVPRESRGPVGDYVLYGLIAVGALAVLYLLYNVFGRR